MPSDMNSARARILDAVDTLTGELVESVSNAIRIPSVNPKYPGQRYEDHVGREGEVNRLVSELHRAAGAAVELVAIEPGRENALAHIPGSGSGRSLLLNGHIDVVPANASKWSEDPFSGRVTESAVHGRGASDDKGGVIAAAYAAIALNRAGVRLAGDLVLHSVVGEEVGDHECGTTAALNAGYTADAAIVVEPSSFDSSEPKLATATPGGLVFTITLEGKTAHSSLRGLTVHPTLQGQTLGVNAIDKLWPIYHSLRELEQRWATTDRHPEFVPGYFNILPGVLSAHPVGFQVPFAHPDTLTIEYCVAHHPDRTNQEVIAEVEQVIRNAYANDLWLTAHPPVVEWTLLWPPYRTPAGHDLVPAIAAAHSFATSNTVDGQLPVREGFFGLCDMTWLERGGVHGVIYGPGVATTAHAEEEYVPISQLVIAAKTYALTAIEYCGLAD